MAKRFFYVAGDSSKAPVDPTRQTKGTDLVCVTPSGKEVAFKAGSKFMNVNLSKEDQKDSPEAAEAAAEEAALKAAKSSRKSRASLPTAKGLASLSAEDKAQKMAAAKEKAAALKAQHPVTELMKSKTAKQ